MGRKMQDLKSSSASCTASGSVEQHVSAAEEGPKPPGMPCTLHAIGTAQGQLLLVCPGQPGAWGHHWPDFPRQQSCLPGTSETFLHWGLLRDAHHSPGSPLARPQIAVLTGWLSINSLAWLKQGHNWLQKGKMCNAGRETGNMSRNLVKGGHFLHLCEDSGSPLQGTPSLSLHSS